MPRHHPCRCPASPRHAAAHPVSILAFSPHTPLYPPSLQTIIEAPPLQSDPEDEVRAVWGCVVRHSACRAVPCRAVPCRAVPCRAVPCRAGVPFCLNQKSPAPILLLLFTV